ncbi:MAG TPA: ABC transporter substrate-binding protein, partial [bacterium]|nr:ABC transporter substrate-binding protein [bacterium]
MKFLKYLIVISVCMGLVLGVVPISFSQEKSSLGQYPSISEYQKATGKKITRFNEAPALDDLVKQGKIPSVEKRLPDEPAVVEPEEE